MRTMQIEARAKINWSLDVTGQRPDGYHLLDMLMQPVTLADTLTLREADELRLTVEGDGAIPADEHNLVLKAARALQDAAGCPYGADMRLTKRIPSQAGLGGGSADAAAALRGLYRLWRLTLPEEQLYDVALSIGADVPFCLYGGLARVSGIGEYIEPLPCTRFYPLVIVKPEQGLPTGQVFQAWHSLPSPIHPGTDEGAVGLSLGDSRLMADSLGNALQDVSAQMLPEIGEAVDALRAQGAFYAGMSGSGSAVFGAFNSARTADRVAENLASRWGRVYRCSTCQQSIRIENEGENAE